MDVDGKFNYSVQVPIKRSQLGKFIYFVSANKNTVFVRAGNKPGTSNVMVSIYNTQGRLLLSRTNKYEDMSFDISNYPAGIYFIKIKSNNTGEEEVSKFVK